MECPYVYNDDYEKEYRELKTQIENLEKENTELKLQIENIEKENIEIKKENTELKSQIENIEKKNTDMDSRLSKIENRYLINKYLTAIRDLNEDEYFETKHQIIDAENMRQYYITHDFPNIQDVKLYILNNYLETMPDEISNIFDTIYPGLINNLKSTISKPNRIPNKRSIDIVELLWEH